MSKKIEPSASHADGSAATSNDAQAGPEAVPTMIERLQRLTEGQETITLGELTREIGSQGHAPLLMIAAIFMILPVGMIPGIGGALGTLVALIGFYTLLGRNGIWLPGFLAKREIPADRVRKAAERLRPAADWLRRHMHRRWEPLARGNVSISAIAVILIVTGGSLLILGAIPVTVPLVGLPIAAFSLGILARDGVIVAVGYALLLIAGGAVWLML
ncbi:exopolysaccharide synthesis protein [Thioclava sp. JM3]|nr:exopolysaccharide synthesis protein [Thioclava sp. JM3]